MYPTSPSPPLSFSPLPCSLHPLPLKTRDGLLWSHKKCTIIQSIHVVSNTFYFTLCRSTTHVQYAESKCHLKLPLPPPLLHDEFKSMHAHHYTHHPYMAGPIYMYILHEFLHCFILQKLCANQSVIKLKCLKP